MKQYQVIIDGLMQLGDAGIILVDRRLRIVDYNDLAAGILSVEGEAARLTGTGIGTVLSLEQYERPVQVEEIVRRCVRSRARREYGAGMTLTGPDGSVEEIRLVVIPVGEESRSGDDDIYAVISVESLVEKRRVWRDLQNLQHADDIRRAATGIAHELNNSSTTVLSELDRLERTASGDGDSEMAEPLEHIRSAVRKVRRLGQQLEHFSRKVEVEDSESHSETSNVPEIVHDTVSLVVGGGLVNTTFSFDPDLPEAAIPGRDLTHALFNVVVNAVEAMSDGGTLRIESRYRRKDETISLIVRDDGTGMDPRTVRNVFRPYFSTKTHGIGMGLTVSLSILEERGGGLTVETEPGFGTTVTMVVPTLKKRDRQDGVIELNAARGRLNFEQARVLVVEDDPLVRRSMELIISGLGCEVTAVHNGERAIEVFQSAAENGRSFDMLVTDLTMPGRINGVQLVHRLREFAPDMPAVLSSGALHRTDTGSYREAGFQYVLRKPFGERELQEALAVAFQSYRRLA
jgi:signal transduction histidine kinase/ActR/RegA family two-component response regulator